MNDLEAWDASYERGENHLFWPAEELVRFLSQRVRRRTLEGWFDRIPFEPPPRALDLGCGIGRHVALLDEIGCEAWGLDHSEQAISQGKSWFSGQQGKAHLARRLVPGDARRMPWSDGHFHLIVSHGVLDSMPLQIAVSAVAECHRLLAPGGLMYLDLVSGDDGSHGREFSGEVRVPSGHEAGTTQLYFNWSSIEQILTARFEVLDALHVVRANILRPGAAARWHLTLRHKA